MALLPTLSVPQRLVLGILSAWKFVCRRIVGAVKLKAQWFDSRERKIISSQ